MNIFLTILTWMTTSMISANLQIDLNSLLSGIKFSSRNVSFNFKNLNIHDGKVEFDELLVQGQKEEKHQVEVQPKPNFGEIIIEETSPNDDDSLIHFFNYPDFARTIDDSIDPCDNFYGHVCNKWIENRQIADDETSIGHMDLLAQRVHQQIQEILEEKNEAAGSLLREEMMIHQFYEKCMRHKKMPDNKAFTLLIAQMRKVRKMNKNETIITNWLTEFRPMSFLVDIGVSVNEQNSSVRIMQLMPGSSILSYNAYNQKEYRHEYVAMRQFLGELLDLLQSDDGDGLVFGGRASEYEARIEAFFEVDKQLAKINQINQYNKTTETVEYDDLIHIFPSINWNTFFQSFVPPNILKIIKKTQIQIVDEEGLEAINKLLTNINQTVLMYYLDWQSILYYGEFFDKRYQEVMQEYNIAVSGATSQSEEKDCMATTMNIFHDVVARLYVQKHFTNETRAEVNIMVDNIIQSFEKMLQSNNWMDDVTKNEALVKLHAIQKYTGYNDQILNATWFIEKYKDLQFSNNDTYYTMMLKIQQWTQTMMLSKLNTIRVSEDFEFPSTDVNAFYDPTSNSIALTAAILQLPYFDINVPSAVNYGAIGIAIGHEITHGFDNSGADFDQYGNRKNWWDSNTMAKFQKRTKCFIDQYSNITAEGTNLTIDGRLTLNENIADNGGIRAAILALKKKLQKSRTEKICGLESMTPMQLFFISNAYVWCSKVRPQQTLSRLYSDVHSPEKWRINTVLSNQPEFSEAFNCPIGSNMNPVKKCSIW